MYIFTYLEFHLMQVNLDFCSEQDMIKKFRVGLALQPVACGYWYSIIFFILFSVFSSSCVHLTYCNNDICLRRCLLNSSLKLAHGVFLLVVINMLSYFVKSDSKISKHQCGNQTLHERASQNTLE
jgi:hypothetical protein